ncbi:MAG: protein-L-isoaspartate(D-aspartate) O-methyltransferase [Planctomycetaceae bacterium]|jgi:protein-L-isoaspartate(D-aspartate) O-methyltransferase|nr:protein-L-isoaspartate(D-aspartate) O-methyltransferase [Planctomycetaceae bacterium]
MSIRSFLFVACFTASFFTAFLFQNSGDTCIGADGGVTGNISGSKVSAASLPVLKSAEAMVNNLLLPQGGLTDTAVIDVMKRIPRHRFVPPQYQQQAYWDTAISIGSGQTISPPYIVAFMTQQLNPKPADKVLEIGTGSGYQAAVLSLLVKDVYSIEIVEPLGKQAEKRLNGLGFNNVHVRIGDGYKGWQEAAPFNSIIVTCSPDAVPQPLVDQLKEGGRMIIPVGERYQQAFYLCKKNGGKLQKERLQQVLFVPMTGEAEKQRSQDKDTQDTSNSRLTNGNFEKRNADGTPAGWHYVRNVTLLEPDAAPFAARFSRKKPEKVDGQTVPAALSQMLQGFALDGRSVKMLHIEYGLCGEKVVAQQGAVMTPTASLLFYDENRRQITMIPLGRSTGTFGWKTVSQDIPVPPQVREAILLLGLPLASGQIDVREVKIK